MMPDETRKGRGVSGEDMIGDFRLHMNGRGKDVTTRGYLNLGRRPLTVGSSLRPFLKFRTTVYYEEIKARDIQKTYQSVGVMKD